MNLSSHRSLLLELGVDVEKGLNLQSNGSCSSRINICLNIIQCWMNKLLNKTTALGPVMKSQQVATALSPGKRHSSLNLLHYIKNSLEI